MPLSAPKYTRPPITTGEDSERAPRLFAHSTLPVRASSETIRPDSVAMNSRSRHHAGEEAFRVPTRRRHLTRPVFAAIARA